MVKYYFLLLHLAWFLSLGLLQASPVKWEIYQAFPSWIEGERFRLFVKIANASDEILPLASIPGESVVEQIRLVPSWQNSLRPHSHHDHTHSHHLLEVDKPWKSRWKWNDVLQSLYWGRALKPGDSEVIGDLGLRGIWVENGMPDPHMESFQLALRYGNDRYALSKKQLLHFADVPKLEEHSSLVDITSTTGFTIPIRQIEIEGEKWLFQSIFRIARVPEGATPRFRMEYVPGETLGTGDVEEEILVIDFEGVEEEPVRILVRQAFPLSGSERTVPHLHLWQSLTDRSMLKVPGSENGFFRDSGLTLEQALALKWDGTDPELKMESSAPLTTDKEVSNERILQDGQKQQTANPTSETLAEDAEEKNYMWLGILGIFAFLLLLIKMLKKRKN